MGVKNPNEFCFLSQKKTVISIQWFNRLLKDVKKKYKAAEKAGTITDAQAKQLFEAKLESESKELAAKKKYYPEFLKVLKPKKVWYAFDLANDKMTKIDGGDSDE